MPTESRSTDPLLVALMYVIEAMIHLNKFLMMLTLKFIIIMEEILSILSIRLAYRCIITYIVIYRYCSSIVIA